jgi:hypothetical protein
VLLALLALLAGACTGGESPAGSFSGPPDRPSASPPPGSADASCPASYAEPDPGRPRIRLTFDIGNDLASVQGTERLEFTPDQPISELVFRLTPNTAPSYRQGNSIEIVSAVGDPRGGAHRFEQAGAAAGSQGGLLIVPLGREVPPGQRVTAAITFTLRLGEGAFDRFGRLRSYAWWGSGHPLLAWERGVGWHREPLLKFSGESATSEAAAIDLTVIAPSAHQVLMSGTPDPPVDAGTHRRRWHAVADRARDVSVAVGAFDLAEETVGGTRIVVGTPRGTSPDGLLAEHVRATRELARHFGPSPFPVLSVARLPLEGGGIEYPGSIFMLSDSRVVAVHETAHQWFYAMVGDSQARDPWLDEAFATYAEQLVDGGGSTEALALPGDVGDPVAAFDRAVTYFTVVYGKGAAALAKARRAAGPARFDAALRCYINANAWRIARPANLERALAELPSALAVLREAGALD